MSAVPHPSSEPAPPADPPVIRLRGARFHAVTETDAVAHVTAALAAGRGGWMITANLDHLRRAETDAEYQRMMNEADLVVADGMPLVWAARLQGDVLPERVAGSDLVWSLTEAAAHEGRSVYLLGGVEGAAAAAADVFRTRWPSLRIAGIDCPPFGFESDDAYVDAMRARIAEAAPDVLYVALGSPKQERVIEGLRDVLPRTWMIGVGVSFSFVAGDVRRAPAWMQRTGLEWVHRLTQEPGRLARRYLVDGLPYAARLFVSSAFRRAG